MPDRLSSSASSLAVPGGNSGRSQNRFMDESLANWSARFRKNKQTLLGLLKENDHLKLEAVKLQEEVDIRTARVKEVEEEMHAAALAKASEVHNELKRVTKHFAEVQLQLVEHRKQKADLSRDKKNLTADFQRKHAEVVRSTEVQDRLRAQLDVLTQHLSMVVTERRRSEREVDAVQHNVRQNTELADEAAFNIQQSRGVIKDTVHSHMAPAFRAETSAVFGLSMFMSREVAVPAALTSMKFPTRTL